MDILPIASGLFCYLSLGNKLGSQVGEGKYQRTDGSTIELQLSGPISFQIYRLTDPKLLILVLYTTYCPWKCLTSLIFNTIV